MAGSSFRQQARKLKKSSASSLVRRRHPRSSLALRVVVESITGQKTGSPPSQGRNMAHRYRDLQIRCRIAG